MDPLSERKCSWCKASQQSNFKLNHPLLCDPCLPKFYKQDRQPVRSASSPQNESFPALSAVLDHSYHAPMADQVVELRKKKAIEVEVFDSHDKLFGSCLIMGRFLGHQIVTMEKTAPRLLTSRAASNSASVAVSCYSQIVDEEFQMKKDMHYTELDQGFEGYFGKMKQLEDQLKKNIELGSAESEQDKKDLLKIEIDNKSVNSLGKEEGLLRCMMYLRSELERGLNHVKQWILDIRNQPAYKQVTGLKIVFNSHDFENFLYCIFQLEVTDQLLSQKIINEEHEGQPVVGRVQINHDDIANQKNQALVQQNDEEEEADSEEDLLRTIAMNFIITRSERLVIFEQFKKRTRFSNNYRLASTHGLYNTEKLKIILYSSRINKTVKQCLDYVFLKGYFPKVEIIIRVDCIKDTVCSKFSDLFTGLSKLRTLSTLSIEVVDYAQAATVLHEHNNLLAFIQGGLPKGITKKLILGSVISSISACIADTLPKSRNLEALNLTFKSYDIDNNQLRNVGAEWSTLTKIQSLNLVLDSCGLITSNGIAEFLESIKQNGSELTEVSLVVEDCKLVKENELDNFINGGIDINQLV